MATGRRRKTYSGRQFILALTVGAAALYAASVTSGLAEAHDPQRRSAPVTELYAIDPFSYETPVSPAWERTRQLIEIRRRALAMRAAHEAAATGKAARRDGVKIISEGGHARGVQRRTVSFAGSLRPSTELAGAETMTPWAGTADAPMQSPAADAL